MPSLRTAVLAFAAALFATVQADYVIDPTSVPLSTRKQWCTSEESTCPIICEQTPPYSTLVNTCDPTTLTYGCVCGNNLQPNVSEYSLTLPYFVCQEWGNQCVTGCGSDNTCASACREDHPCGALDPTRVNTTSSASAGATATGTNGAAATTSNQVYDGFGDSSATATAGSSSSGNSGSDSSVAAASLDLARAYSLVVVVAGMFVGFGFML
ncbi:hypothetical protein NKR23_g2584 [Pleurostoma richardsiae]|uniref:DUF7707 domain-containing protein n=1 Tax=Pleurostoma richardsiae TaxID=41990 RepID=A0AA38VUW6_9PEZI|nr:hypothetical protein NKR23_g2584 [Pleurostoma richardsiae]